MQLKETLSVTPGKKVYIQDVANLLGDKKTIDLLMNTEILETSNESGEHTVLSVLEIIEKISKKSPDIDFFPIGDPKILIRVCDQPKKENKAFTLLKLILVCMILSVGTGLALMNFHADVNMGEAHKQLYKMLTGLDEERPLILQIPYSFGIGLGMAVFFNHMIPKKYSDDPSPMEIEMYSYRKNVDEYLLENEKDTKGEQ